MAVWDVLRSVSAMIGGAVAMLFVGVALVFPGTAFAVPTFLLGVPDPCPSCDTVTFDGSGLAPGTKVTNQFAAEHVSFYGAQFDDGSLGQNSAPGFSGGSLVSSVGGFSDGTIVMMFDQPMVFAAFAFADTGVPLGSLPRTFAVYLGSQKVAKTELPFPPARFLAVAETFPAAEAANAAYLRAADKAAADSFAVQTQTATVTADQANIDAAVQAITAAQIAFALDYANYVACNNPICTAIELALLASDIIALNNAGDRLNAAGARLQTDQAQLAVLQQQYQDDQAALSDALNAKTAADALYEQALADPLGPGFIGFAGAYFDTLILAGQGWPTFTPTFIDTLEMVPEPSTFALLGGALAILSCLRRIRRTVPVVG